MKKKKKGNLGFILLMVASMIIGGVCGVLIAQNAEFSVERPEKYMLDIAVQLAGMLVILMAHIAIHEAGHLIFGLLTGYGFSSYRLGSFMLLKENGKLRFRRLSIPGTGGQCLMTPPDMVDGKIPNVLYNLGGCILNGVTVLIALAVWLALPKEGVAATLLMMTWVLGLVLLVSNALPLRMGGVDTDGRNALMLGKNPKAMRAFWLQLKMNEQLAGGVRLKDMPDEWFELPQKEDMENSLIASVAVFAANRLMDAHRFDEARARMDELLQEDSGILELHRKLLVCDAVYCEVMGENREEIVKAFLTKEQKSFMQAMKTSLSVLRTEYVVALLVEKDMNKAKKTAGSVQKGHEILSVSLRCPRRMGIDRNGRFSLG